MTLLQVKSVRSTAPGRYEVTLADMTGAPVTVICTVAEKNGVLAVAMHPDLVMTSEPSRVDSRELARTVLDHHQREAERTRSG